MVGQFIEEGSGSASRSVLGWVVNYVDLLRRKVWLEMCMRKSEVSTHGGRWGGPDGDIESDPGIGINGIIAMFVWRRVIIGHIVDVLQVLWLTLCGDVFDGWRHIFPVHAWLIITSSILCRKLNTYASS